MAASISYPRGSEWRKWDLHIHTKSDLAYKYNSDRSISKREKDDNEYPGIFVEHLYSIDNLGAIAITDHNHGDWIDRIIRENEAYALSQLRDKIVIFPGVEVESSDGIHLLVIFNPDTAPDGTNRDFRRKTWKETIEHFLTSIQVKNVNNSSKTTEEILEEAEKWDAIVIFAHVTSDKGFFKISSGYSKTRIYKHRLTQIFQISSNFQLDIGQQNIVEGKDKNYIDDCGKCKSVSCITASDAKDLDDIGKSNLWIKADPTFQGLKQIIYEPEERIYIGQEPPRKIERNKIIQSITISHSNGWFRDGVCLLLNEELVAIIGGKGSGKTAFLDFISYATENYKDYQTNESKSRSFLKRAFKQLKGTSIKIDWQDGSVDQKAIGSTLEESDKRAKVRYLPQDYVDQLCSESGKHDLENQIDDVIFQNLPEEDKANFINFSDYSDTQLRIVNTKKKEISTEIKEKNALIYQCKLQIQSKDDKIEQKTDIEKQIDALNIEIGRIAEEMQETGEQKELFNKTQSLNKDKADLQKSISQLNLNILKIDEIKHKITLFLKYADEFKKEIMPDLDVLDVLRNDTMKLEVLLLPANILKILEDKSLEFESNIVTLKSKLNNINEQLETLRNLATIEETKRDKLSKINRSLSELNGKKNILEKDIKRIEDSKKTLRMLINERQTLLLSYFDILLEEKEKLKAIYSPLKNILQTSTEENQQLFDFVVRFNFDLESMANEGYNLIDLRSEGSFRQSKPEMLEKELEKIRSQLNLECGELSQNNKRSIVEFVADVEELFNKAGTSIGSQLKTKTYTEEDFDNWLYSTRYYSISYSINFNGIDLDSLSPGLKGVALLILFLELDKEDKRPILIDQPEENLDNRFVYLTLVKYFRKAKKNRQVIIATHNPNLVVNTDSEQVIVANFDKKREKQNSKIAYISGSLENTFRDNSKSSILERQGIKEHVCEILEGGREAFEKREKKYGF
ncbi:MAG: hypothetical protein BWX81_00386 [Spirochaetes bacterium ADurb.Bin110]|nr:MAG: hypothetical protein BWX81_00386 [Spirochaetes bacterium ADurb.Bin110]